MDGANENVTPAPEVPLPGIDVSVCRNLYGDRQIILRTMVTQDTPVPVLDKLLDTLSGRLDRQAAHYDLEALEKEIRDHETTLRRFQTDLEDVDGRHVKALAMLDEQILEIQKAKQAKIATGEADHQRRGRQGGYKPQGKDARDLEALDRSIERVKEEKSKAEAERLVALKNLDINIQRYGEEILIRQERVKKLREIVG